MRQYSLWDHVILGLDKALQSVNTIPLATRPNPAAHLSEAALSISERRHAAGLMRVNHVGEVCAQALYQGQALTARSSNIQKKLQEAAQEEADHLKWCEQRLEELKAHPSYLNAFWYSGALLMGLIAGLLGDKISLGFLAETEHQVERHLNKHLQRLPLNDKKSRAIVEQMRLEEIEHATTAEQSGAIPLPLLIQFSMQGLAKFMTLVAYKI
ncbi:2-nonaprenyl-3-methyl-6-methoxy-1 4-benzoquinol hydroxylase [Candidatus Rickettsiella viridis]|uniref:3-demethoxyubiquinol 3-hydroxylase n=1 Tax=Candidatus Rickettsiella viridis TaxID=676208 RepID=A0A2Z5UWF1_9COXI|nr:2-polyprenyl-3-methyl-6-methoxy-1,4-benzoquinone monooxygenase [Candidatus Rickettsiella viridis]BBB15838.1 2-nonaprenyl-3-methyl-6-methoxy-1 4-benzoquinol hydroxylase [Candidatus Rickettsiella viridis]